MMARFKSTFNPAKIALGILDETLNEDAKLNSI